MRPPTAISRKSIWKGPSPPSLPQGDEADDLPAVQAEVRDAALEAGLVLPARHQRQVRGPAHVDASWMPAEIWLMRAMEEGTFGVEHGEDAGGLGGDGLGVVEEELPLAALAEELDAVDVAVVDGEGAHELRGAAPKLVAAKLPLVQLRLSSSQDPDGRA